ncbi:MAG: L,D-transpeptidase family protein [Desulfobacteraceae bacterium]|nr:L,D-transpeptidase family protein [Desulfobacteraceae bacterium]
MLNTTVRIFSLISILSIFITALLGGLSPASARELKADRVLVKKSERILYLLYDGQIIRKYRISLGLNPIGHKQQRGDKRTPEGAYILKHRNPQSKFYKSILLSYPNEQDRLRAETRGEDPGGDLAIHGLPNRSGEESWDYIERDWTDGCIAVTNDEMEEIWDLVDDGTPIEILP